MCELPCLFQLYDYLWKAFMPIQLCYVGIWLYVDFQYCTFVIFNPTENASVNTAMKKFMPT